MAEDNVLLREFAPKGSQAAFDELVRRHVGLVYHAALRQLGGDTHAAQDVTQEVFLHLARRAGQVVRHPTLAGWLYQTSHYKTREWMRAQHRWRTRQRTAQALHLQNAPAEFAGDWDRVRPWLDEAMMELGRIDREAIIQRYFLGRSYAEIGAELGLSDDSAQKRVDRALEKLRRSLARRGLSSSSAALALALATQTGLAAPAATTALVASMAPPAAASPALAWFCSLVDGGRTAFFSGSMATASAFLCLSALGLAWREARAVKSGWDHLAAANQSYLADQRQLEVLLQRRQGLQAEVNASQSQSRSVRPIRAAGLNSDALARIHRANLLRAGNQGMEFLREYPQAKEVLRAIDHDQFFTTLHSFVRSAHLTEAQASRLENLYSQVHADSIAVGDRLPASVGPTVPLPTPDQIRTVLDPDSARQFENYRRSIPARAVIQNIQVQAGLVQIPISDEQIDQMTAILAGASSEYRLGRDFTAASLDWPMAMSRLRTILPAQFWPMTQATLLQLELGQTLSKAKQAKENAR